MKRPISIVLAFALVVGLAACGASTGGLGSVPSVVPAPPAATAGPDATPAPSDTPASSASPVASAGPDATPATTPTPTAVPGKTMVVRAYFVLGGEPGVEGLVPVLRTVPETTGVARAVMVALLEGPTESEAGGSISTAIPDGTTVLGVSIRNTIATVDLSTSFDSGGGTASMQYRLAQVVYTLTQFSTIRSVIFQVEGQTVTVFGAEGINLDRPQKRFHYGDQLPAIFVDGPAYGAAFVNTGGHVVGTANVFEATFRVAILDAAGKTLADDQAMAACGTGCRGNFDLAIGYTVTKAQWGTLRAYDPSEKDGSPESIRDYPVWLTPKP